MRDELKKSRLFSEFDHEELEALEAIVTKSVVPKGEHAFLEGEPGDSLILIRMGTLQLMKKNKQGEEQELAALGTGSYVGDMAMFDKGTRTASGIATERTEIFRIPYGALRNLLDANVGMAAKFYKQMAYGMSRRLHFMNQDFTSLKSYLKQRD